MTKQLCELKINKTILCVSVVITILIVMILDVAGLNDKDRSKTNLCKYTENISVHTATITIFICVCKYAYLHIYF